MYSQNTHLICELHIHVHVLKVHEVKVWNSTEAETVAKQAKNL